jgi:ubiquinone/menaquinone biosynthesis C-methylase UbiE
VVQVPASHYDFLNYETPERFASYWRQISCIIGLRPKNVLEIGIGSGLTRFALKRLGIDITTADLEKKLDVDFEADVRTLPFRDNTFDVVAAFQILEHLPFTEFSTALEELSRVSARYICISLPDSGRYVRVSIRLTWRIAMDWVIDLTRFTRKRHVFDGQHYWEINRKGFGIRTVREKISKAGLKIISEDRFKKNLYHRFFILEK